MPPSGGAQGGNEGAGSSAAKRYLSEEELSRWVRAQLSLAHDTHCPDKLVPGVGEVRTNSSGRLQSAASGGASERASGGVGGGGGEDEGSFFDVLVFTAVRRFLFLHDPKHTHPPRGGFGGGGVAIAGASPPRRTHHAHTHTRTHRSRPPHSALPSPSPPPPPSFDSPQCPCLLSFVRR